MSSAAPAAAAATALPTETPVAPEAVQEEEPRTAPVVETEIASTPTPEVAAVAAAAPAATVEDKEKDVPAAAATVAAAEAATTTPLAQFFHELPSILTATGYNEMWGITLTDSTHVPTSIVLEKFLRANSNDVGKAGAQLISALEWRKKIQPLKLLDEVEFSEKKFGGLGFVTAYDGKDGKGKEVVTWNIYGAVKDNKETFGDVEEYVIPP